MLLRFSVRNFRSIGEEQEISLVATSLADIESGLIEVEHLKHKVLPAAVIYGANASGKSNLLKALRFFRLGILSSYKSPDGKSIQRQPFLLDGLNDTETSSYEADFVLNHDDFEGKPIRLTYGFVISDEEIIKEWLYAYPKQYRQVWYYRDSTDSVEYYFGKELKGQNKVISLATRKQALFLSTAYANNHPQLSPIYEYFQNIIFNLDGLEDIDEETASFLEVDEIRNVLIEFLREADVGICEAKVETLKRPEKLSNVAIEIRDVLQKHYQNRKFSSFEKEEKKIVKLGHRNKDSIVYLSLEDESRGTIAFLNIIGWIFLALAQGSLIVIDELDSSLHPLLCRKIVGLFNKKETNPNNAQLLFSTHDTTLLSNEVFRRDQVWLAQKDEMGLSRFYPLSDLKLRKGDNLQKGYLEGKFGAIPFIGDFDAIMN